MTPEIEKKRRELYESRVVLPDTVQWNEGIKSYTGVNFWLAQFGWDAFNAAMDAVEIELPSKFENAPPYASFQGGWNDMREEAIDAITATGLGLKVKP